MTDRDLLNPKIVLILPVLGIILLISVLFSQPGLEKKNIIWLGLTLFYSFISWQMFLFLLKNFSEEISKYFAGKLDYVPDSFILFIPHLAFIAYVNLTIEYFKLPWLPFGFIGWAIFFFLAPLIYKRLKLINRQISLLNQGGNKDET